MDTQTVHQLLPEHAVLEIAPGDYKRVGDCSDREIYEAGTLGYEKADLQEEISRLWLLALDRHVRLPRMLRRRLRARKPDSVIFLRRLRADMAARIEGEVLDV